tara:strand:- start:946 stop:1278 length:333 start_codon:yes stop_codon:yes gene_type:complete
MSDRTESLSAEQVAEIVALRKIAAAETEIAEARAVIAKRQSRTIGMTIMGIGCIVGLGLALHAQITERPISFMGAGIILAVIVFGGMIMDPERYERIAGKLIDAAPGGRN